MYTCTYYHSECAASVSYICLFEKSINKLKRPSTMHGTCIPGTAKSTSLNNVQIEIRIRENMYPWKH